MVDFRLLYVWSVHLCTTLHVAVENLFAENGVVKRVFFCPLCFVSYDPAMFSRWFLLISDVHWCVLNASLFFSLIKW